ncbi:MAG: dockerin type I domain-containing protein, partial [Prevotellaceae bacterium]|nr:dockerin type I domain-containing protein [Prevotellaceae bacterium]
FKLLNNLNKINSNSFGHAFTNIDCILAFLSKKPNCPPIPPDGGECNPINSYDPNDIYGYLSESGSRYVKKDQADLYYTIEFENDTAIATAAAHEVIITDTLDNSKFDLSSFEPTEIRIGDKVVELDGNKSTVVTVDMRPEIYTIAQMKLDYEEETGIAKWHFTSLDPMTLDPTDNPMSGFLPVNYSGNGMGEVSFNIKLKDNLDDGVSIENSASIVFDYNDPIITPIWTNIMDTIAPVSTISSYETTNDSTFTLHFEGSDKRSGIWKYELYVQENKYGSWIKNEDVITDSIYMFKGESGLDYGFCVLAVDSAGNVENKKLAREAGDMTILMGDVNEDGVINSYDASLTISYFLGDDVKINTKAAEVSGDGIINSYDAALIIDIYLDTILKTKKNVDRQRIKSKIKDYEKY